MNDLEIFQLIVENIEDKHPQNQIGITPLHIAVENREDKTIESAVPFPAPFHPLFEKALSFPENH